jgi:hypothetical protein
MREVLSQGRPFDLVLESPWPSLIRTFITSVRGPMDEPSPKISVVTPWRISPCERLSTRRLSTDQESMLMKPGVTALPAAFTTVLACAFERSPTAATRSPRTPTSARTPGRPVPS